MGMAIGAVYPPLEKGGIDREGVNKKMDEHIREILEKPHITNEDYEILRGHAFEHPEKTSKPDLWLPLFTMLMMMGGGTHEL